MRLLWTGSVLNIHYSSELDHRQQYSKTGGISPQPYLSKKTLPQLVSDLGWKIIFGYMLNSWCLETLVDLGRSAFVPAWRCSGCHLEMVEMDYNNPSPSLICTLYSGFWFCFKSSIFYSCFAVVHVLCIILSFANASVLGSCASHSLASLPFTFNQPLCGCWFKAVMKGWTLVLWLFTGSVEERGMAGIPSPSLLIAEIWEESYLVCPLTQVTRGLKELNF